MGGYICAINYDYLTHRILIDVKITNNRTVKYYPLEFKKACEIHYKTESPLNPRNSLELTSINIDKKINYTITMDIWMEDNVIKIVCEDIELKFIDEDEECS